VPPRSHDLIELAKLGMLDLTEEQSVFLKKLTLEQQKTRYPEDIKRLSKTYSSEYAQQILQQTEEFRTWLLAKIKSVAS
jgi:HEPN domain-containing protein